MAKKKHKHKSQRKSTTDQSSQPQQSSSNSFAEKYPFAPHIIVFFLAFAIYSNTFFFNYALDDAIVITSNMFTKEGISGIGDILANDSFVGFFKQKKNLVAGGRYRPLSIITFAIEYEIFGKNPAVSHFINVVLYGLTCVLIFMILKKLIRYRERVPWYLSIPFLTVILYASHPIHTEAVANIKGRDEIMTFLGALGALFFTIRYLNTDKLIYLLFSGIVFFLALMSKENAITFVAVIPLTIYFFTNHSWKKNLISMIPVGVAAAVFLIIRQVVLGDSAKIDSNTAQELLNNPFLLASDSEKYATVFYTLWHYIQLLIFPHPLTYDYYPKHFPIIGWSDPKAFLSFFLYLGLGAYAVWGIIKKQLPAYGVAFYLITLSIVSNLVFPVGTFMNERFVYISSLGFVFVVAWFIHYIAKKDLLKPQLAMVIAVLLTFGYSARTFARNFAWQNDFTLFLTDIDASPNSIKGNLDAGGQLWEHAAEIADDASYASFVENSKLKFYMEKAGLIDNKNLTGKELKTHMLKTARTYLDKSVKLYPNYNFNLGWLHLGNTYQLMGNYEEALVCYKNAININPEYSDTRGSLEALGQNSMAKKNHKVALETYNTLLGLEPGNTKYNIAMASVYEAMDQPDKALQFLEKVLQINPESAEAYNQMGQIYGKHKNDVNKAVYYLGKALQIKPNDVSTLINIAIASSLAQQYQKAENYYNKALQNNPTASQEKQIYHNMAAMYYSMGDNEKAAAFNQKAQGVR